MWGKLLVVDVPEIAAREALHVNSEPEQRGKLSVVDSPFFPSPSHLHLKDQQPLLFELQRLFELQFLWPHSPRSLPLLGSSGP